MPVCFASGGLVGGLGAVLAALAALAGPRDALGVGMRLGLIALVLDMMVWAAYAGARHGSPARRTAVARLRSGWVAAAGVGLGQLAPFVVLVLVLGVGEPTPGRGGGVVVLLAGLAMAAGGAIRKWAIVRRACLLHSLGLDAFRSAGRPGAVKPAPGAALCFPQT
jgi:hypothetical protein